MTDYYSANRRRRYEFDSLVLPPESLRDGFTKRRRLLGKLKHQRALEIDCAVQTAGKLKVAFQQRAGLFELINHLVSVQFVHLVSGACYNPSPNAALRQF